MLEMHKPLIPFLKLVSPIKTRASSQRFASIKDCVVCFPPSIITDCIFSVYKISQISFGRLLKLILICFKEPSSFETDEFKISVFCGGLNIL